MSDIAISVEGLSKRYQLGQRESYKALRDVLSGAVAGPFRRLRGADRASVPGDFWALQDVSFEVRGGEVVGIIGRNGAGKSTLLKILSRITKPTSGRARIHGRVGSLLEVGTGFHPELTGRENIFLNGAILGMRRQEILRKFDEIVDFAEIEKFIDTPVKHYSSGMYTRLAFAVAAHLEPEVLLVDEVLAVGDAAFQKKCLGKMGEVAKEGRTVLFVSHNMGAVQTLCARSILLTQGTITMDDLSQRVILRYFDHDSGNSASYTWRDIETAPGNDFARLHRVQVLNADGYAASEVRSGEDLTIEILYTVLHAGLRMGATVVLFNNTGDCVFSSISNQESNWHARPRPRGIFRSVCHIPKNLLADGQYSVTILLWQENYQLICRENEIIRFSVIDSGDVRGDYFGGWSGVIRPYLVWNTEHIEPMIWAEE